MATSSKERQATFKQKMREAGQKQITVWADEHQAGMIRAMLEGQEPEAPTTTQALVGLDQRERALKAQWQELEQREDVGRREVKYRLGLMRLDEDERGLKMNQEDLARRLETFKGEQAALTKKEARAGKINYADRRAKLVEIHTTRSTWNSSDRKAIDTAAYALESAKEMSDLSRKTNIASNTIRDLLKEFGQNELLSEREQAALALAGKVLTELASAAGDAKDMVRAKANAIKDEEEARNAAAKAAAFKEFGDSRPISDICAVMVWGKSRFALEDMGRYKRLGLKYCLDEARRAAQQIIIDKIAGLMKDQGANVAEATRKARAEFEAIKPGAVEKHAELIQDINTALVAARMEAANAKGETKKY